MRRISGAVAIAAVALVSVNLRPGASSVGTVLEEIRTGLDTTAGVAGVLTGLPGLAFGVVGLSAVGLAKRTGITGGIALGLVLAVAGLSLRAVTSSTWLFLALSVVALAGMALGNVLVPAWIKAHASRDTVLLPTLYGTGLIVGGALGSAFTAPVAATGAGWRWSLGMWGLVACSALPVWLWLASRERSLAPSGRRTPSVPGARMTTSPTAVAMAALFGVQSMHAYVQFGWLPQIYRDAGISPSAAGLLLSVLAATGIVGALLMPTVIARSEAITAWMLGFGALLLAGYVGLLVAPATMPWLWALLLGVAGWAFPTSIALLTARTREASVTARLSGFVQPVGYALAAVGPVVVGLIHQATDGWRLILALLALTAIPFTWAGVYAARPVWVDDELAA
ncbi:MFS transporter [Nocardioides seonyuensis]|uniref:MFS transporter n=1 Tax=Nocardioides seonyuensis TaxID=2518371 RepID=A0A4P7IBN7_9ACTN|nr:MFS transporter [Nocardioides seonyuensis]QBX54485.1 MFS transporter [Nocardioides seonyuensis]